MESNVNSHPALLGSIPAMNAHPILAATGVANLVFRRHLHQLREQRTTNCIAHASIVRARTSLLHTAPTAERKKGPHLLLRGNV